MKEPASIGAAIALMIAVIFARPGNGKSHHDEAVFIGDISDSMCGLQHPMADKKKCTLGCVKGFDGATFVLADHERQKVYDLSNRRKAKAFAAQREYDSSDFIKAVP